MLLIGVVAPSPAPAPDTLVVCPARYQPAIKEWEAFRRGQGHEFLVITPPATADELKATIRNRAKSAARLKYIVLIGDAPTAPDVRRAYPEIPLVPDTVPTNYMPAKVNIHW